MGKNFSAMGSRRRTGLAVLVVMAVLMVSCMRAESTKAETAEAVSQSGGTADASGFGIDSPVTDGSETQGEYILQPEGNNLKERFHTPSGFVRTNQAEGSFGAFVRDYELLPDGSPVLLYNGEEKGIQTDHAAVFNMHLSSRDLQQCADSVMRIYAEYYWKSEQYDKISFRFVSGFQCAYSKWKEGNRVSISGNNVQWLKKTAPDTSWESFEQYLNTVFAYASTLSMREESVPADIKDVMIGDVFLHSGSPGHVVMVADVCENENGERAFLLAQGYMPAQQFHVLKNPLHENDPWYYTSEFTWPFQTPEFTFGEGTLRRMTY